MVGPDSLTSEAPKMVEPVQRLVTRHTIRPVKKVVRRPRSRGEDQKQAKREEQQNNSSVENTSPDQRSNRKGSSINFTI